MGKSKTREITKFRKEKKLTENFKPPKKY